MRSLWNDDEARPFLGDSLATRVYTSRLLGRDPALVMHGGGNTSVKIRTEDFFGDPTEVLYVKGSGWDLATIEAEGFAPVRLDVLERLATFEQLSDSDMVREQRSAMLDPSAPSPSVEAILHGILPFRFVDHSHADAVVALTNTADGEARMRELYGESVLIVPYVMPGFVLARTIYEMTRDVDWSDIDGMVLLQHGVFTFHDDGRRSYERMIEMVDAAERVLRESGALAAPVVAPGAGERTPIDGPALARLRKRVGVLRGAPVLARLDDSADARGFAARPDVAEIATRGPLTPGHVIRTKRVPLVLETGTGPEEPLQRYAQAYDDYFQAHTDGPLTRLDPAPRFALRTSGKGESGSGSVSFGRSAKELRIIEDIARHTRRAIQWAEHLGGWQALPAADIFEVEYWELEQAKLKKGGSAAPFQGKVALVTGAAGGIGRATAEALLARGAAVLGVDLDPKVEELGTADAPGHGGAALGLVCDVTDGETLDSAFDLLCRSFGGLDLLVSNAGTFPPSRQLEQMDEAIWQRSLEINLTAHQRVSSRAIPLLEQGFDPSVIFIGSKNVPAPGPGAAAYSVAKAGLTQLARVAALELGPKGIRVQVVHPHAVFDTAIWTEEVLASRAEHYGMTVDEYRRDNLLGVEITSTDVAATVCALAGPAFRVTTGAQIPLDGGNERVI
ncbi:MAG: bifunctional aldolase/short-chain dehydrogenase [Holophagales bacterium]|nr:bifunctional aldolase/short-chain dehydrogenase [Holophagales bacterium]